MGNHMCSLFLLGACVHFDVAQECISIALYWRVIQCNLYISFVTYMCYHCDLTWTAKVLIVMLKIGHPWHANWVTDISAFCSFLQDLEFLGKKLEDIEKSMKRSNDKQLKIEHELCERVSAFSLRCVSLANGLFKVILSWYLFNVFICIFQWRRQLIVHCC